MLCWWFGLWCIFFVLVTYLLLYLVLFKNLLWFNKYHPFYLFFEMETYISKGFWQFYTVNRLIWAYTVYKLNIQQEIYMFSLTPQLMPLKWITVSQILYWVLRKGMEIVTSIPITINTCLNFNVVESNFCVEVLRCHIAFYLLLSLKLILVFSI